VESLLGTCSLALDNYFKTFEPVQHRSRSVESMEEASILGMFPVQAVLLAHQWLNLSTHSLIAVELNWISGRLSRSCTQVAECGSVQSRYVSSWMTTRNQSVVEFIHSLTQSGWIFWISGCLSRSSIKVAECAVADCSYCYYYYRSNATTTRSISGGIGSNHHWISRQLNLSCIKVAQWKKKIVSER